MTRSSTLSRTRLGLAALACLTACGGALGGAIGGALAQNTDPGLDLAAVRARADEQTSDADALAASARERARVLAETAAQSADQAKASGQRYSGAARQASSGPARATFDFDQLVAGAGDLAKESMGQAPRFLAFASLSMPPEALRQIIGDVARAGGVVVFRGLTKGSAKIMTGALARVFEPSQAAQGVGIDPRLFRAFAVTEVPTYIVTASDFDLCDGFDCSTAVPPFDRLTGNVTAQFALETFARGGGPSARIAAQHLARLEGKAP